jgi:hypothetical protein
MRDDFKYVYDLNAPVITTMSQDDLTALDRNTHARGLQGSEVMIK